MLCSRDFAVLCCYCHDYYASWFSYGRAALVHAWTDGHASRTWNSGLPPESQNKYAS